MGCDGTRLGVPHVGLWKTPWRKADASRDRHTERVYYQIASYTGDSGWVNYAQMAERYYRDQYVVPHNGKLSGYWNFTTGLRMDYERTGDAASRDAIVLLSQNAFSGPIPLEWTMGTETSREVAYAITGLINAEAVGAPHQPRLDALIEQALGHL